MSHRDDSSYFDLEQKGRGDGAVTRTNEGRTLRRKDVMEKRRKRGSLEAEIGKIVTLSRVHQLQLDGMSH